MARLTRIQTNMTAGELSPRLLARTDIARYQNAMSVMENAYPLVQGGGNRRPGQQYVGSTKTHAKRSRLLPFVYSADLSFVLEFGDGYIRFFLANAQLLSGGLPYEIASPYLESELPTLNYTQSGDTMFLFHPNHPIYKLKRSTNTSWVLGLHVILVEPHDETGINPATTATLASAAVGTGVVVTASAAAFQPSDVGRPFTSGAGVANITGYTDSTHITVEITTAFAGTALASGAWNLGESPKATATPSVATPEGAAITVTLGAGGWQDDTVRSDVGRYVHLNGGVIEITGVSSATAATGVIRAALVGTGVAQGGYWSEESKIWNAANGYPRCGTLFDQRLVVGGTTAYPNGVWGTKTGLYNDFTPGNANDDDGLDFRMVSDQQNPVQQLSSVKQLLAMTYSTEFSLRGGIEKPLTSTNVQVKAESVYGTKNVRPVRVGKELIYVQRSGRKVRALGLNAATDNYDSPNVSILSEHVTKTTVTEMCYAQEPDSVMAMVRGDGQMPTLTIEREQEVLGWARQVTDGLVESVCSIPYNNLDQVWCIVNRTVGGATRRYVELMEFNEEFENNRQTDCSVTGKIAPITTTALSWLAGVLSVATLTSHGLAAGSYFRVSGAVPEAYDGDYLVDTAPGANLLTAQKATDPGTATTLGTVTPLAVTWSGFSHIEGKTVDVLGDGGVFPAVTVASGQITLSRAVASIEVGLHYRTTLVTLPPEIQLPEGTVQGRPVSINECTVRLYNSIGGKIENEQLPYRRFGTPVLNKPIAPYTGDKEVPILGWKKGRQLTIIQDQPLPFCVLGIITKVTVGD